MTKTKTILEVSQNYKMAYLRDISTQEVISSHILDKTSTDNDDVSEIEELMTDLEADDWEIIN